MRRSTSTIAALLCAFLTLFCVAPEAVAGHRLMRGHSTSTPPPPAPPTVQTAYWGPSTLNGHGGYDPCKSLCTYPVTGADTTNFYWDTTNNWVIPKNGATKTYSGVRSSPLSGTEDWAGCDSAVPQHCFTIHNEANAARAGNYTIRWRPGDTFNSVSGTNQLFKAYSAMSYGQEIAWRDGDYFNTTMNAGQTGFDGKSSVLFKCATSVGTCANFASFTGSNYKVIRPETGGSVTLGSFGLQEVGTSGTKITGFTFALADNAVYKGSSAFLFTASPASPGSNDVWLDGNTFIGNPADDYGSTRPGGIRIPDADLRWKITNNNLSYVYNGMSLSMFPGTYPTDVCSADPCPASTAPSDRSFLITGNTLSNVSKDALDVGCIHHTTITNNVITDKRTVILVGTASTSPAWVNPFDSDHQNHADLTQFDCPGGVYKYWPGTDIENNVFVRGQGRDDLPFWTSPPFPTPNVTGNQPSGASTPNPLYGQASGQGLYWSNICGTVIGVDCNNGAGHTYNGSAVVRPYNLVAQGVIIKNNVIMMEFANGINVGEIDATAVITGNVVISPHPPATNLYDTSAAWNFGKGGFQIDLADPAATVTRNISGGTAPKYGGAGTNVNVVVSNQAAFFQNPGLYGSPRTLAEYKAGYLPIRGGDLEIDHVNHIYAGPFCWDGSTPSSTGVCPP